MNSVFKKLAEVAAQASMPPQGGPPPGGAPAEGMDPSMMAPPDPVAQDNEKLTNILQNLQLRVEVVEAQKALAELTAPARSRKSFKDPDRPRKTSRKREVDISAASTMTDIVKNMPKRKRKDAAASEKSSDQDHKDKERRLTLPGRGDTQAAKDEPIPTGE